MKEIKDKFVPSVLFFFVLEYLNATECKPIFKRQWETYDLTEPQHMRHPKFSLRWLTFAQFNELLDEAVQWFRDGAVDINEETRKKYSDEQAEK